MRTALVIILLCLALPSWADDFKPIPPDANIDQVLQAMKDRGDNLGDVSADVTLTSTDDTGDSRSENGKLLVQKLPDGNQRARITFVQRTEGEKIFDENHQYTLVDGWTVERDYLKKQEDRRQVVQPGQKVDLFKLGAGPFPMPIGQKPQDVKDQFDVVLAPAAKDEPQNTVHLTLKPKPGSDLARKYASIDVWTDRQSGMPVRIVTSDSDGQRTETTELKNLRLDAHLTDADFALPPVQGWDVVEEPYRQ
jgi:outer membrane lipoprotein-sorting protein